MINSKTESPELLASLLFKSNLIEFLVSICGCSKLENTFAFH